MRIPCAINFFGVTLVLYSMINIQKKLTRIIGENKLLSGASVLAVLSIFYAAFRLRHVFTNQDGLNYVAIAQNYLAGNLDVAINAYWSPFISWLMTPFLAVGFSGTVSFMAVNALAATTALLCGLYLISKNTKNKIYPLFYILTITPFLMYSVSETTPDVWVIAWVLLLVAYIFKFESKLNIAKRNTYIKFGLGLGLVGAFGYFIKLYTLPVFICVAGLFAGLHAAVNWSNKKKKDRELIKSIVTFMLAAFLTLAVFVGSWTAFIYGKYHQITPGSSFSHNIGLGGSGAKPKQPDLVPIFPQDPTYSVTNEKSRRPANMGIIDYYWTQIRRSTPYYLNNIRSVNVFMLPIMILSLAAIIFGRVRFKEKTDKTIVIIGIVFWVYFLGYLLAAAASYGAGNLRYYWPLLPLAILVSAISLPKLWKHMNKEHRWQKIAFLAIVACFPLSIYYQYFLGNDYPFTLRISRDHKIVETRKHGLDLIHYGIQDNSRQGFAKMIASKNIIASGSKISGNNERGMLYIAYETKSDAYSYVNDSKETAGSQYMNKLKSLGIDYYVLFSPAKENLLPSVPSNIVFETVAKYPCGNDKKAAAESCHISIIKT